MPQATLRIRSNDPQSPADLPLTSLIGNQTQTAECDPGYVGDDVVVPEGEHTAHTLAQANAAALAAGEGELDCIIDTNPPLEMDLLTGAGSPSSGAAIVSLGGGPLLVGGPFIRVDVVTQPRFARGNAANPTELDAGFTPSVDNGTVRSIIVVGSDYYIGGQFDTVNGYSSRGVAKLSSANVVDTGFTATIEGGGRVTSMARQSDGKLIIGGSFTTIDGAAQAYLGRLNTNGTHDAGFAPVLFGTTIDVRAILIQSDGKILCAGNSFSQVNGVARVGFFRLNSDGTLDTGFVANLLHVDTVLGSTAPIGHSIAIDSSNRWVLGGAFTRVNNNTGYTGLARGSLVDGAHDTSWKPTFAGYTVQNVNKVCVLADGGLVIAGAFTQVWGSNQITLAIIESTSSTRRTSFSPVFATFTTVNDVVQEPISGQLLITGLFVTVNGVSRQGVARLNLDGTLA